MTFKGPLKVGKTYELNGGGMVRCSADDGDGTFWMGGHWYSCFGESIGPKAHHDLDVKRCIEDARHWQHPRVQYDPQFYDI